MDIDLGFAEARENAAWLSNRYFPSKLGGRPAWLELEELPTTKRLLCNKCEFPKAFLCQLYAPFEDTFNFHRSIYVFICRNAACQQANNADNFTVLRAQLPRTNKYFSEQEPVDDGEPLPPVPCLKKLCAACGCYAPLTCSRCKSVNYCSATHQRAHWIQHKPNCGSAKPTARSVLTQIEFPEYEIVMDINPIDESINDSEDEKEQDRLDEFDKLAASGKTGALSNISEAELDKYFGSTAAADDETFRHFKNETAAEPEQIIRYKRGGTPLWITNVATTVESQLKSVPNCSQCGEARQFEFQIMPQMLVLLKEEFIDWGVLAIYTCAKSCEVTGYANELIIKQDLTMEQS